MKFEKILILMSLLSMDLTHAQQYGWNTEALEALKKHENTIIEINKGVSKIEAERKSREEAERKLRATILEIQFDWLGNPVGVYGFEKLGKETADAFKEYDLEKIGETVHIVSRDGNKITFYGVGNNSALHSYYSSNGFRGRFLVKSPPIKAIYKDGKAVNAIVYNVDGSVYKTIPLRTHTYDDGTSLILGKVEDYGGLYFHPNGKKYTYNFDQFTRSTLISTRTIGEILGD